MEERAGHGGRGSGAGVSQGVDRKGLDLIGIVDSNRSHLTEVPYQVEVAGGNVNR